MSQVIERPEIIRSQVCYFESGAMGLYLDVDGASPTITNHLAEMSYQILKGSGVITTTKSIYGVEQGDMVTIPRGEPYAYVGDLGFLVLADPGFYPEFVTFNGQPLDKAQRHELRHIHQGMRRTADRRRVKNRLESWVGPRESHLAYLGILQKNQK